MQTGADVEFRDRTGYTFNFFKGQDCSLDGTREVDIRDGQFVPLTLRVAI